MKSGSPGPTLNSLLRSSAYLNGDGGTGPSALPDLGRSDIGPIAIDRMIRWSLVAPLANIVSLNVIVALSGSPRSFAVEQPPDVPAWLRTYIGEGEGQIAQVVLERARALYLKS